MRTQLAAVLVSGLFLASCGDAPTSPSILGSPASPTAVTGPDGTGASTPAAHPGTQQVPFRSEVAWDKAAGSQTNLCTRPLPDGTVYLQRNTLTGTAVSAHLGTGVWQGHTCVYGTPAAGPQGWFMDVRWTAANGDVLVATSDFQRWTGTPGSSTAIEAVTFQDGGTGRFQLASGEGTCWVNAPGRTAVYEGMIRYGKAK